MAVSCLSRNTKILKGPLLDAAWLQEGSDNGQPVRLPPGYRRAPMGWCHRGNADYFVVDFKNCYQGAELILTTLTFWDPHSNKP